MIETKLDIINKLGLHARAAAKVVSVASRYESRIHVIHNGKPIDAKSIMGLLMLGAAKGSSWNITMVLTIPSTGRLAEVDAPRAKKPRGVNTVFSRFIRMISDTPKAR